MMDACWLFWRTAPLLAVLIGTPAIAGVPDVPTSETRTSRFEYDTTTGLLVKEIIEPTSSSLCVVNEYQYDTWGNKRSATTRNCNGSAGEAAAPAAGTPPVFVARTTSTVYDTRGQFPVTVTNSASQSETHQYDARFGSPTSLRGPNLLTTTWTYDAFGRKSNETRADGTTSTWTYTLCQGAGCSPRYTVAVTASGAPTARTHFDNLGREIANDVVALDGATRWRQEQAYDGLGRVTSKTRRFVEGDAGARFGVTTFFEYDQLNRVWHTWGPTNASAPHTYIYHEGLKITEVNPRGHSTVTHRNAVGQKERVVDARGAVLRYGYDAFGNLVGTDASGAFTVVKYDLRGRKIEMEDPDMGRWTYEYDALGQLRKQTDAKSQVVTMLYDVLGRMTQRTEPDLVSNWEFDVHRAECGTPQGKAVGKLARAWTSTNYSRIHCYDHQGRPWQDRTSIGTETFVAGTLYDQFSRVSRLTYPTGYQVEQRYSNGYFTQVVDVAANKVLWQVNTLDANGQLRQETLGNGVVTDRTYDNHGHLTGIGAGAGYGVQNTTFSYDQVGNLYGRTWVIGGVSRSETHVYDETNRLTTVTGSNGPSNKSFSYDPTGNLLTKTGIGTYWYIAGTHRLQWIQGTVNGVANPSFAYDNNGNITGGAGYTTTYTSYNKPSRIQKSGATASDFSYGPEHQRIRQIAGSLTTLYLGSYERDTNSSSGLVEHKHFIVAAGALIAQYTTRSDAQPAQMRYMHRDHLGSVVAVTDEAAAVVVRYSYDAWGKRRNTDGSDATITTAAFDRGYTGHEMLDGLQLVHMNGRVYDPNLGRFMSADFIVPDAAALLGYNRYAYVYDNPLSLIDPSGHKPFWRKQWFKKYALPVIAIVASVVTYGALSELIFWELAATTSLSPTAAGIVSGAAAGAASGGVGGLIASGGDMRSAAQGALTGGVFGGIGALSLSTTEALAVRGAVGCLSGLSSGGGCQSGAGKAAISYISGETAKGFLGGGSRGSWYDVNTDESGIQRQLISAEAVQVGEGSVVRIGINGLFNDLDAAVRNLMKAHNSRYFLFFNPSDGLFADLGESFRDYIGWQSPISAQFAGDLRMIANGGSRVDLWGHSQGSLIAQSALDSLSAGGANFAGRLTVSAFGPAANERAFGAAASRGGGQVSQFLVNQSDFVATVIGRNAGTPLSILRSVGAFPMLFGSCERSQHSSCAYFGK